jgi:hypothetical protein
LQEEFEETKGIIRTVYRRKINRQHNGRKKQRSTEHTHKTKDRVKRTPQKPGVNSGAPEG